MIELYSPQNVIEQALIESILASDGIKYFIQNDLCGALNIGPSVTHINHKMILVPEKDYSRAKVLIKRFLAKTKSHKTGR